MKANKMTLGINIFSLYSILIEKRKSKKRKNIDAILFIAC